jgi:hypothetical protein
LAGVSSLLTVYYNGEDFFLEMNQSETRIACGGFSMIFLLDLRTVQRVPKAM